MSSHVTDFVATLLHQNKASNWFYGTWVHLLCLQAAQNGSYLYIRYRCLVIC